jgi:hypothetical protein
MLCDLNTQHLTHYAHPQTLSLSLEYPASSCILPECNALTRARQTKEAAGSDILSFLFQHSLLQTLRDKQ